MVILLTNEAGEISQALVDYVFVDYKEIILLFIPVYELDHGYGKGRFCEC